MTIERAVILARLLPKLILRTYTFAPHARRQQALPAGRCTGTPSHPVATLSARRRSQCEEQGGMPLVNNS
jgi:hypothetical protein